MRAAVCCGGQTHVKGDRGDQGYRPHRLHRIHGVTAALHQMLFQYISAGDAAAEAPGKVDFAPSVPNPGLRAPVGPHGDGSSVATVALWYARMSVITVSVVRSR